MLVVAAVDLGAEVLIWVAAEREIHHPPPRAKEITEVVGLPPMFLVEVAEPEKLAVQMAVVLVVTEQHLLSRAHR
jgi:hypothetical protein